MLDAFELDTVSANGIKHRVALVKKFPPTRAKMSTMMPLVMLMHGWPESWYSWRHQLLALAEAGYSVRRHFPPTMRSTILAFVATVWALCGLNVSGFTMKRPLAKGKAPLTSLHVKRDPIKMPTQTPMFPYKVRNEPLLSRLQRDFGTCLPQPPYSASRKEQKSARFHYIVHHNLPHVEDEYDRNCEEALYRLYSFKKPAADDEAPEVTDKLMFPPNCRVVDDSSQQLLDARSAPGFWARLPRPKSLPSFQSQQDFQYFVKQYRNRGFAGGLKWYQVMDINWFQTQRLKGKKVEQPSLFIIGADDRAVLRNHGGLDSVIRGMKQNASNLVDCIILPDTGHWIQQERHQQVSSELIKFVTRVSTMQPRAVNNSKL